MTMRLDGKVAIVTGAGSGNGRAIAIGLAAAGAAVCAADVLLPSAEEAAATIAAQGGRALAMQVDVASRDSVNRMVDAVVVAFSRLDILVNNAGIMNRDPITEVSEELFDQIIGVNLKGPLLCMQAAVPYMRAAGGGSIINVVSTSAEAPSRNQSIYAASKGGLKMLTQAMAIELAQYNIRANGIHPGPTVTGMSRDRLSNPAIAEQVLKRIPAGRLGQPEDHVGPAVLLASDASSWMTGAMLTVDGGYLALG